MRLTAGEPGLAPDDNHPFDSQVDIRETGDADNDDDEYADNYGYGEGEDYSADEFDGVEQLEEGEQEVDVEASQEEQVDKEPVDEAEPHEQARNDEADEANTSEHGSRIASIEHDNSATHQTENETINTASASKDTDLSRAVLEAQREAILATMALYQAMGISAAAAHDMLTEVRRLAFVRNEDGGIEYRDVGQLSEEKQETEAGEDKDEDEQEHERDEKE